MITAVHACITNEKVNTMREYMKNQIRIVIFKTVGTLSFIRRLEWRCIFEWLDPEEGERILDVACGAGTLSLKIGQRGCRVHGIDLSEGAINSAKLLSKTERLPCDFEVGNAEDLPYPDGYFDKVVFSSSLEHIEDDMKALQEACRVLKPKGKVILTTDSLNYAISDELKERHRTIAYVVNYYTPQKLEERFENSGFKMNRYKYLLNSPMTSFFYKIGIKMKWCGILWIVISFLAYPLCWISERLSAARDKGYTLLACGEKMS